MANNFYRTAILSIFVLLMLATSGIAADDDINKLDINNNQINTDNYEIVSINNTILESVDVYFFYSKTCPHCIAENEFLKSIENNCENLEIHYYESAKNWDLFTEFTTKYNTSPGSVPRTFIHDKAFIGYSDSSGELEWDPVKKGYLGYKNVILDQINSLLELTHGTNDSIFINQTCEHNSSIKNLGIKESIENSWLFILIIFYGLSYFIVKEKLRSNNNAKKYWISGFAFTIIICLFIFFASAQDVTIKNIAEGLPFPFFVGLIALADGFNPCAFTVLIILLSLLTYTKSRKDMTIIGMTFIITSAIMYFIFIIVMIVVGSWALERYGHIILLTLGFIILIAGLINIKDFFFLNKGPSLSISNKDKLKVTRKARKIVNLLKKPGARNFIIALFATILLAIFVNLIELGCTAILPTVYMASLIKSFGATIGIEHIIWTTLYAVIYIIPLLIIMLAFIYSFKSTRISEKHGKILKLATGLFMIIFGLIMLFWPEMLILS